MSRPIIAIQLDSAEPSLIRKWMDEGQLPNLSSLERRGFWRALKAPSEVSSGATYATANTGMNPAKHGMGFFHRQLKSGTYEIRKKYAHEAVKEPFWTHLARAGKRVAIIEIAETFPQKNLNGIQLVGWGSESLNCKPSSWPKPLFKEVVSRFGKHPLHGWYQAKPRNPDEWLHLLKRIETGAKQRIEISKWVLQQEDWDFFMVSFAEPHWTGHFFWHLFEKTHPQHDPESARVCGDALFKIYQLMDVAVGELIKIRPEAIVFILSTSGMGPNYSGVHLVPDILKRLGMEGENNGKKPSLLSQLLPYRKWGAYTVNRVEKLVSTQLIEKAKRLVPEELWDKSTRWVLSLGNNWKNSRAFAVPNDFSGAVRINLKGREPHGKVEPGQEYDELCEELKNEFLALINPETGKKVVREVIKVRDTYEGENIDELPDLLIHWTGEVPIRSLSSPRIGTVNGVMLDKRSGAHRRGSFLIGAGEGIETSKGLEVRDLMDFAPTILQLMGQPIPSDMDGKVLFDILQKDQTVSS